jgi:cyanophycinase
VEVVGSGAVTIVDPSEIEFSSMDQAAKGEPVCLLGIRMHVLVQGASFNLHSRVAAPGSVAVAKG